MNTPTYATIVLELSKAGIHAWCEELDKDAFCINGDLQPLVKLINDAEVMCSPDTVFMLTEKGKREARKIIEENHGKRNNNGAGS